MTDEEIISEMAFRPMRLEDEPFVFSSWLNSYWDDISGSTFVNDLSKTTFYRYHHKVIDALLKRSRILIGTPKEDSNVILAYIVMEEKTPPILHYLYVKESFRNEGIATYLAKQFVSDFKNLIITHLTVSPKVQYLRNKYSLNYIPYLMGLI